MLTLMLPHFTCDFFKVSRWTRYPPPHVCFRVFSRGPKLYLCTKSDDKGENSSSDDIKLPPEPQNCCMSGCANCVWVSYAEELAKILNDGGETARQKIMEFVKDPSLRAFILLELEQLLKKKSK